MHFALGDISGKGIGAALMAAMSQGRFRLSLWASYRRKSRRSSEQGADTEIGIGHFLTLFCAVLDAEGRFTFVNAGHNPPILVRADGSVELLSTGALLLGAFSFAKYEAKETQLRSGDVVVIYTDGVTEAVNSAEEMFGDERLEAWCGDSAGFPLKRSRRESSTKCSRSREVSRKGMTLR
jgi:sigma-B regulation protein RsbU (phosphoserine phosphatase)